MPHKFRLPRFPRFFRQDLPQWTEFVHVRRLLFLSLVVGAPTGLVAVLFAFSIHECSHFFGQFLSHYTEPQPFSEGGIKSLPSNPDIRRWALFFIPALGGLISGFLVYRFAPEAEGHGTDQVIDAFHRKQGKVRARVPVIKLLASAITIGSGGSAGREGPVAQVGAGVASVLAGILKLSDRDRRNLVLAGVGAGVGSIFQAPLGGALFAVEVLYRGPEFEFEALIPCFVASIVAYSAYCALSGYGWHSIFQTGPYTFNNPTLLVFYLALAGLVFVAGRMYVECFYFTRDRVFRRLPISNYFKPALGGLMLGVLAMLFTFVTSPAQMGAVYGAGYGYLQLAISNQLSLRFLLLLALFKIVATSLTIGSGGSGGVFGPSVVIGGLVGGAFGQLSHLWFPTLVTEQSASAFALVGMAGFFAGVANVPVSALIMVSEMTAGYTLLTPLMLVTAVAYSLSPRHRSMYVNQVVSRADSPAHTGDFNIDVLRNITAGQVIQRGEVTSFEESTPLVAMMARLRRSRQLCFPVVDKQGGLMGMIAINDLREAIIEPVLATLIIARDLARPTAVTISESEPLSSALRKLVDVDSGELPVVSEDGDHKIIGMLGRRDLIVAYNQQLQQRIQ